MKKLLSVLFFLLIGALAFGQEQDLVVEDPHPPSSENGFAVSLGAILEGNMNSPEGYALSEGIHAEWNLSDAMGLGLRLLYGNDFRTVYVLEILPFFRYYLLALGGKPAASGLFAQADLGTSLFWAEPGFQAFFNLGLTAGYRLGLGSWYIEPHLRAGIPYAWGFGIGAGYRF
jgi:hypothetical protein